MSWATLVVETLRPTIFSFLESLRHLHESLCDSPCLPHTAAAVEQLVAVAVAAVVVAVAAAVVIVAVAAVVALQGCTVELVDELYY